MTIPSFNSQTFCWVKVRLDQLIDATIDALSDIQATDALPELNLVSKNLHQIQGVLQMLELDAASIFAEDLKTLSGHPGQTNNLPPNWQNTVNILTDGLNHLKFYLHTIEKQGFQSLLVLIDNINAIRHITGEPEISQYELFKPSFKFEWPLPEVPIRSFFSKKRQNVLYHLRKRFRQALLAWLNNRSKEKALDVIRDVMSHLYQLGGPEALQQLWWVATGFLETIKNGNHEPDSKIKAQFSALDMVLYRMDKNVLSGNENFPAGELIRNMLFHIGKSIANTEIELNSKRISEIRHLYDLNHWFSYQTDSSSSNGLTELESAVKTLGYISRENVLYIEKRIDPYFFGKLGIEHRIEFFDNLNTLRASVEKAGFGIIRDFVFAICDAIQNANLDTAHLLETGADVKIASALLLFGDLLKRPEAIDGVLIESLTQKVKILNQLANHSVPETNIEIGNQQQAETEHSEALRTVIKKIKRYLNEIEQLLSDTFNDSEESEILSFVINHLLEISNLFRFLEEYRIKSLIQNSVSTIQGIVDNEIDFTASVKEKFAIVVVSIEACTDMIAQKNDQYQDIIARAQDVLNTISQPVSESLPEVNESENNKVSDLNQIEEQQTISSVISEKLPLKTEALIENLESGMEDIGISDSNDIKLFLGKIHDIRKSIHFTDPDHEKLLHLLLLFNSIEDHNINLKNTDTRELAALGSRLITRIIYDNVSFTVEVEDYIDRLSHQIEQMELKDGVETRIDLSSWTTKLNNLEKIAVSKEALQYTGEQEVPEKDISEETTDASFEKLRQIFQTESKSVLSRINGLLAQWRATRFDQDILTGLKREFHTLKGSAASSGYESISKLSHAVESMLEQHTETVAEGDDSLLNLMEEMHDGIASELGFIPSGNMDHMNSLISMVEILLGGEGGNKEAGIDSKEVNAKGNIDNKEISQQAKNIHRELNNGAIDSQTGVMRIENTQLNSLLDYSAELGLTRTQLNATLNITHSELDRLRKVIKKIRQGFKDLEFELDAQIKVWQSRDYKTDEMDFDPLETDHYSRLQARTREVNQQLDDLARTERQINERTSELGVTLVQQSHLGAQLQDGLIHACMVPVNEYFPGFRQLTKETSKRVGKRVNFSADGGEIIIDRRVMGAMVAPFEHMIRNAIIHGVEPPDVRETEDKPTAGRIHMRVIPQGAELLIEFSDDGRGLDKLKLSERAIEKGLANSMDTVSDDLFLQIIAEPGYSTAGEISMESGRGIGMDVVLETVRSLGGSMKIVSTSKQGTTFEFRLPVTMTISRALLVRIGEHRFAVLTRSIDRVMRIRNDEVTLIDDQEYVSISDQNLPIFKLTEKSGEHSVNTEKAHRFIILVWLGDRTAVFEVDHFEETVEIIAKKPGKQLTSITGITGVTVLADSSIVLILNPEEFLERQSVKKAVQNNQLGNSTNE